IRAVLPLKKGELGIFVSLEALIAVQVIFRYIQQYPGIRAEGGSGIQLEAAQLKHENVSLPARKYPMAEGRSDISANEWNPSGLLHHFADQSGCCSLPVSPCNRDHREADLPRRPLELPDYLYSPPTRLLKGFDLQRNPGADYYEVFIQKIFGPVASQPKRAARVRNGIQSAVEFRAGAQIRRAHFHPPASEQSAYGPARYAKPDHQRFFGGLSCSHSHSPTIASMIFSIVMPREPFTSIHAPGGTTRLRKSTASA